MNVLLAVDGSEAALHATRRLVALAPMLNEPLHVELVTVNLPVPIIRGFSKVVVTHEMIDAYYRDQGASMLAESERLLNEAHVDHSRHILVGKIAESLVDHADKSRCQMIWMGSRGMSAVANMVMGSIATKVVHLSLVPVVLVP